MSAALYFGHGVQRDCATLSARCAVMGLQMQSRRSDMRLQSQPLGRICQRQKIIFDLLAILYELPLLGSLAAGVYLS